jgi:hypothetical protein
MRTPLLFLALTLAAAAVAAAEPPSAAAEPSATAVVCTAIVDNRCEGPNVKFPANVGKLYGFSEAVNVPNQLVHVWFFNGRELGRIAMKAPSAKVDRWLTWSNVTVSRNMTGPWRLEAQTTDGKVLATFNFTVE